MDELKIGDKVYVTNWGKRWSDFHRWRDNNKEQVFPWKTELPEHITIRTKTIYQELTKTGKPYKRPYERPVLERIDIYKSAEYEILEILDYHSDGAEGIYEAYDTKICLLNDTKYNIAHGYLHQVDIKALTKMNPEQQEKAKHLQKEEYLRTLALKNFGKWTMDNLKGFPKELVAILYDKDQRVAFGSDFPNTKGIVIYRYVPKEYSKSGNPLFLGWEVSYNGEGCDLSDKETIDWKTLPKMFPETIFEN